MCHTNNEYREKKVVVLWVHVTLRVGALTEHHLLFRRDATKCCLISFVKHHCLLNISWPTPIGLPAVGPHRT